MKELLEKQAVSTVDRMVCDGALEHLDALTRRHTRHPAYYGHIYPAEQQGRETRVVVRIHGHRITVDEIHR